MNTSATSQNQQRQDRRVVVRDLAPRRGEDVRGGISVSRTMDDSTTG